MEGGAQRLELITSPQRDGQSAGLWTPFAFSISLQTSERKKMMRKRTYALQGRLLAYPCDAGPKTLKKTEVLVSISSKTLKALMWEF